MNSKASIVITGNKVKIVLQPPGAQAEPEPGSEETCMESLAAHDLGRESGHTRKNERHPSGAP